MIDRKNYHLMADDIKVEINDFSNIYLMQIVNCSRNPSSNQISISIIFEHANNNLITLSEIWLAKELDIISHPKAHNSQTLMKLRHLLKLLGFNQAMLILGYFNSSGLIAMMDAMNQCSPPQKLTEMLTLLHFRRIAAEQQKK